ncbi:hypothetical protein [Acinetobacter guillouiae]|uniref:hypothetical protein n=1 Tax=Acinetobacter guillouiae TaxID=106649 RepID=UPI00124F78FA|nr:hypothetical protein [Acinetobacter guillouiae]
MNKTLITLLILLSSSLLRAEPSSYILYKNDESICIAFSYYASIAFAGHQYGEVQKIFLDNVDES